MKENEIFDVTIIGGGPTGLFTAFYAGIRQMSVKIIESLPQVGGQLAALYPEKYIYDVPGFPKIRAQELVDNLMEQLKVFPPSAICLEQAVEGLVKLDDGTIVITTNKEVHYSKTVIITAGNGAFQSRKIEIENADKFAASNLHYFVNNMNQFENQRVQVFGGGDSALDWSLMLEPIAKEVSIVHRRNRFRAHESSVAKLQESTVNVLTPYIPIAFIGENRIEQVVLQEVDTKEEITIDVDAVLVNYGFVSSLGPIKDWGLDIVKNSIVVNSKMETNIEGVYAVGDINTYEGKVKLIVTGFGEAPTAISNAKVYIDPKSRVQPLHSTSIMEKKEESEKKVKISI